MISVSIIIVTYNSSHRLKDLFDSFKYLPEDMFIDLVIVDNASQDVRIIDELRKQLSFDKINTSYLIELGANYYWSFATNVGILSATGTYILLLNPDCILKENAISNLFKILNKFDIVSPKMVNSDGSISGSGGGVDRKNEPHYFNIGEGELDEGQYDTVKKVEWVSGACMLFKKDIYYTIGPFREDGDFYHYNSDREFCLRAVENSYTCGVGGKETEIIHLIGKSCRSKR